MSIDANSIEFSIIPTQEIQGKDVAENSLIHVDVQKIPKTPLSMGIRGSDGRFTSFPSTDAQSDRNQELYDALTRDYIRANPGATPFVNLDAGRLEENGRIVGYFTTPEQKQNLEQFRNLFDEVLGKKYDKASWYSFRLHDRAPFEASRALRNPTNTQISKEMVMEKVEIKQKTKVGERYDRSSKLIQFSRQSLTEMQEAVLGLHTLDAQSRAQQISAAREFDEFPVLYAAAHKVRLLSITRENDDKNAQLLTEAKNKAIQFINAQKHVILRFKNPEPEIIDKWATQLALLSCRTREQYDFGLTHFKVPPTQASTELFLIELSGRGDKHKKLQCVDHRFHLAFSEITNPQDRETLKIRLIAAIKNGEV